jgi:plasmid stabilization system protein ParE
MGIEIGLSNLSIHLDLACRRDARQITLTLQNTLETVAEKRRTARVRNVVPAWFRHRLINRPITQVIADVTKAAEKTVQIAVVRIGDQDLPTLMQPAS